MTNQEKCLLAKIMQEILEAMRTNQRTTTAYYPQANGQVERLKHTLGTCCRCKWVQTTRTGTWPYLSFVSRTTRVARKRPVSRHFPLCTAGTQCFRSTQSSERTQIGYRWRSVSREDRAATKSGCWEICTARSQKLIGVVKHCRTTTSDTTTRNSRKWTS
jgi:hypothetical protein